MAEAPVYDEKLRQYVLLSDYLIPYLKKSELDTEAETILRLFYPEALVSPVPVNAFRLAGNMGFSVRKAKLSDNFTRPAGIFFEKSEIRYRSGEKTKEAYEKIIPELALFYGVSEFTAGKRLNDLIYSRKLQ